MAMIEEMRIGGAKGALVRIWDDLARPASARQAQVERGEAAYRMLISQLARGITPKPRRLAMCDEAEQLVEPEDAPAPAEAGKNVE